MPALSYREVYDRYNRAKAFGDQRDLPTYAKDLNDLYDTQDFSQGLKDNWLRRGSTWADANVFEPIAHATTEPVLGAVGSMFGAEDVGRRVGLGLPRGIADTAALFIPGAGEGYGAALAAGATGGLMAAHTYADTGSPRNAAISGITGAILPSLAHVGGALGLRAAGAPLARGLLTDEGAAAELGNVGDFFSQRLASSAPEFLSQYAGSQAALAAGSAASAKWENPDEDVFSKDFATQFLLGQIPFTALDLVHGAKTLSRGLPSREEVARFTQPEVAKPLTETKPLEPRVGEPEHYAALDQAANLAETYAQIANDPTKSGEEKSAAFANYQQSVLNPDIVPKPATPDDVIVQGYTNGRNRILVDSFSGDPAKVPDHKTMVFYPNQVKDLQHMGNGEVAFKIAPDKINAAKFPLERPFRDPNQADLLVQEKPVQEVPFAQQLPKKKGTGGAEISQVQGKALEGQPWEETSVKSEKVSAAAIRYPGGEITAGPYHGIAHEHGDEAGYTQKYKGKFEHGFITNKGRFISGEEANALVGTSGMDATELLEHQNHLEVEKQLREIRQAQPLTEEDKQTAIQMGARPEHILRLSERLPKSADPILNSIRGGINLDAQGRVVRMGNTDVGVEGEMNERRFLKRTQMPKEFLEAAREMYPEAFTKQGVVNVNALVKGLQERPIVQVRRLDVETQEVGALTQQAAKLQHEIDTRFPNWQDLTTEAMPQELKNALAKLRVLQERAQKTDESPESATARHSTVNPYPPEVLRGEKEVAPGHRITWAGDLTGNLPEDTKIPSGDKNEMGWARFQSQHYPSDAGKNQLFFVRGALHEFQPGALLPNGKVAEKVTKIFEVWEVQSDWAAHEAKVDPNYIPDEDEPKGGTPLLSHWEPLALSSAVQQARALGADAIALSDGESAMMTEGHDKAAGARVSPTPENIARAKEALTRDDVRPRLKRDLQAVIDGLPMDYPHGSAKDEMRDLGFKFEPQVSQAPGMTAAYDTTYNKRVPKAEAEKAGAKILTEPDENGMVIAAFKGRLPALLEKITGRKGEKVDFGVHQNAGNIGEDQVGPFETKEAAEKEKGEEQKVVLDESGSYYLTKAPEGSPVFRNPDGSPKTSNTARLFPLDKISSGLAEDPTASIKEAVHMHDMAQQREAEARAKLAKVPETPEEWLEDVRPTELKKLADSGLSHEQALAQEKLAHGAEEVDAAMTDQEVAKEVVRQKTSDRYAGRERTQYAEEAVKNEHGGRLNFPDESSAYAHRETLAAEQGRDPEDYALRNNGRGQYYLVEKLNRKISLDIPETGGHERVSDTPQTQAEQDVEEGQRSGEEAAPEVDEPTSVDILKDKLRALVQMRPEDAPPDIAEHLAGAQEFLRKMEMGEEPAQEEHAAWDKVRKKYLRMRKYDLGSSLPHDEVLAKEMNLAEEGPIGWLKWYVKNTTSTDFMGVLMQELVKVAENSMNRVRITNNLKDGWHYIAADGRNPAELNIPNGPLSRDSAMVDAYNVAHEVAHHVTRELESRNDPKAKEFRKTLEDIITHLEESKALPKAVRDGLQKAKKDGVYVKTQNDPTFDISQWYRDNVGEKHEGHFGIFYGLLDRNELISQVFGSPEMVKLLAMTPHKGVKERVMDWFARAWRSLVGSPAGTENALAHLLSSFDDYLGKGSGYTGMDFIRDKLVSQGVRPEGLASRIQTVKDMLRTGKLAESAKGWDREDAAGILPVTSAYSPNLLDLSRTPGQLSKDVLGLAPAYVKGHSDLIVRLSQDAQLAQQVAKKIAAGEIPGKLREGVLSSLGEASAQANAMKRAMARYGRDADRLEGTRNLDGSTFRDTIAGRLRNVIPPLPADEPPNMDLARDVLGLATPQVPVEGQTAAAVRGREAEKQLGKTKLQRITGALERTFLLGQHYTSIHPAHAARNNVLQTEESEAHDRGNALMTGYTYNPETQRQLDPKVVDNNSKVKTTPRLERFASPLRLLANDIEQKGRGIATWDHPEIQAVVKNISSPADRAAIKLEYESAERRNKIDREIVWPRFYDRAIPEELAETIAARDQVLPDSAREVAQDFYQTRKELADPETAPLAVEKLRALMTKLSPDTGLKVLAQLEGAMKSSQDHLALLASRPHYTSEQRYGQKHVTMLNAKGEPVRLSADSLETLQKQVAQKKAQGAQLLGVFPKEDATANGGSDAFINKLEEIEGQWQQRKVAAMQGADALTAQTVNDPVGLAQEVRTSMEAARPLPGVVRKFREGREFLNMPEQDDIFHSHVNNYMRVRMTRLRDRVERLHPEIAGNLELKKFGDQMLEAFMTPDNPIARRITSAVFFNKLAFEFGNNVLESLQHLTTGMQQLISETGTVGDAFDLTQKASKAFWQHKFTGKWQNEDQAWLEQEMKVKGHDVQSSWDDIHDPNMIALRRANSGKTGLERGVSALDQLSKNWSGKFQGYGNYIGMFSAFEHGRAQGMSREQAFDYAANSKNQGMYTGGKGQRPGLWRIKTKAIPQLMSSLQTYTLGWFGQMYKDYVRGFSRNRPQGLTRAQIEGSKKAFLYGLAVQATLAGALGLPGVGQGLALLQQATGVDMKGWVRGHMQDLFDEDQQTGGGITSLAMNGLLAGTTPFDPSGRAGLSVPFTGVDSFKGFSFANLAGAPGATLQDYAKGLTSVASGDRTGWEKLLPNFLKRPARLAMDDGDVKDARGGLLYQLSPAERAWTLAGLPPSRIQRTRDVAEAAKNAGLAQQQKQEGLADSLAKMFDQEGPQAVQQKLVELGQTQPELDLRQLVKQIGERRERQQTPFDWRREVNPASELQGLNVYNPSTVAQGRAIQQQTQAALGLRPTPNPRADMEAMAVDQLLNSGAAKTEAEARKMLARQHSVRPLAIPGLQ